MMEDDLFAYVRSFIEKQRLFDNVSKVIVACSGGADSTALLHLLLKYSEYQQINLVVAHVNYALRGAESDRDEQFVRSLCLNNRLPFFLMKATPAKGQTTKDSIQMQCRSIRFDFFRQLQQETKAERVALGHTLDDNMESFFIRLVSGAGLEGLKGMLPLTGNQLVRPLLTTTRSRIEDYLHHHDISYVEDSSNSENTYLRNKIRHLVLPHIEQKLHCKLDTTLGNTLTILRTENNYIEETTSKYFNDTDYVQKRQDRIYLDRGKLGGLHPALQRRLIIQALYYLNKPERSPGKIFEKVETLLAALEKKEAFPLTSFTGRLSALANAKTLEFVLSDRETIQLLTEQYLTIPGQIVLEPTQNILEATLLARAPSQKELFSIFNDPLREVFDAHTVHFPLLVRSRKSGDRFVPYRAPGSISIKKFLINNRIPRQKRPLTPLVLTENRIIWVAGIRRAQLALVTPETRECLLLSFSSPQETPED